MKKLSLLIALCMLISIGGVYATWVYTNNTITPKTGMSLTKEMGDVEFKGASGAYSEVKNTLKMKVVPKADSYDADLEFSGELVITFIPDARITDTDLARALNAVITVVGVDLDRATYKGTTIYSLSTNPTISTAGKWTPDQTTGAYTFTLDLADLDAIINIAEINLPNYQDFRDFQTAHQHAVFKLNIEAPEATVPPVS